MKNILSFTKSILNNQVKFKRRKNRNETFEIPCIELQFRYYSLLRALHECKPRMHNSTQKNWSLEIDWRALGKACDWTILNRKTG